jgi:hypothetical protein
MVSLGLIKYYDSKKNHVQMHFDNTVDSNDNGGAGGRLNDEIEEFFQGLLQISNKNLGSKYIINSKTWKVVMWG